MFPLDNDLHLSYNIVSLINKTVEAEIKIVVHSQRVVLLGNDRTQIIKWTAEGLVKGILYILSILRRKAYVSCQEYVCILMKVYDFS